MAGIFSLGSYFIYLVVYCGVFYQFVAAPLLWTTLGYGREVQQLSDFNATCTKVEGLGLEGCEDMWFHEETGLLYMACGNSVARTHWFPPIDNFNLTGRLGKDRVGIIDTRAPGPVSSRLRWMKPMNFEDSFGGKSLDLHGMDITVGNGKDPMINLLLINHRPPIGALTEGPLSAAATGANSTIEIFTAKIGDTPMRHLRTYQSPVIKTPNRVAWVGNGAFIFSNDKGTKTGWRRQLELVIGGGSVGYCDKAGCKIAVDKGLNYPNGLIKAGDGLIYVPSSITGKIEVMTLESDNTLRKIHTITLPHPIDNLSADSNGDIFASTFPQTHKWLAHAQNPTELRPPTAVWRIRKLQRGDEDGIGLEYETVKVLEGSGEFLPGATIAIHDPQTGRFFLGGAMSPYISICETRKP